MLNLTFENIVLQWDRFNVIDSVVKRKVKVGPCIRGLRHWRATVRTAAQVCSPSGGWEGLIDLIVCAHSSATPAAGHTQWADCAWGCQMTAARGCPLQPKYVIADHGHTLENSWEHNVINSDKKERENKEKDVPVQKWIVLSVVLSFEKNFWKGLQWICANVDMAGAKAVDWGHWFTFRKRMRIWYDAKYLNQNEDSPVLIYPSVYTLN